MDYDLVDCPWNDQELEAFYEMANTEMAENQETYYMDPNTMNHQTQQFQPSARQQPPHAATPQFIKHSNNQFAHQLQREQKAKARGPKLAFLEFDGTDLDGWIRKAEKFFEMVSVPNEDKVKIAVMYMKGRARYWWRGSGCNSSTLPWHHLCRMIGERFNEVSTYEVVG